MLRTLSAALAAALIAAPALAGDIKVEDAYARSSNQKVGGAFMVISNGSDGADALVEARADISRKVELHTHIMEDGVARMREVPRIEIPAKGKTLLQRGGYHVMFMGLTQEMKQGESFPLTLVFESGEEVVVDVTIDHERKGRGKGMKHGHGMKHGKGDCMQMGQDQAMKQGQGQGMHKKGDCPMKGMKASDG